MPPSALPEVGAGAPTPPRAGAPPRAPGDFLMRRKSPKTHQEPPGSWTSGTRGRTPLDSPAFCPSGIGRGNLNPQASSGASHPPSHGLKAESVPSMKPEEKTRPICPLSSKWQIGLGLWQKVARRETERSAASAKRAATTHRGIPKGAALGAPLVTFPATGKSPGVGGAERPPLGGVGAPAPTSGERRGGSAPSHPPFFSAANKHILYRPEKRKPKRKGRF